MLPAHNLIDEAAVIYKVLGNNTRLTILYYLRYQEKAVAVSQIVNDLGLAQPIVSKQLGILYRYQLVCRHKKGTRVFYALDDPHIVEMTDGMFNHVRHEINDEPHPNK